MNGSGNALGDDVDTVAAHFVHESLAQQSVEAPQQTIVTGENSHLGPECPEHARQLHGDIAAAYYAHPVGAGIQLEETVRGDSQVRARYGTWPVRSS